jgi:hypothetical protein
MDAIDLDQMVRKALETLHRSIGTRAGIARLRIRQHAQRLREKHELPDSFHLTTRPD